MTKPKTVFVISYVICGNHSGMPLEHLLESGVLKLYFATYHLAERALLRIAPISKKFYIIEEVSSKREGVTERNLILQ